MHKCQWFLLCLSLAASGEAVQGQLVFADFDSSHLMRIMPAGDSITDDCSTNGGWRLFLQPLLEASGISFTNVGRIQSGGYPGFTKRRHEGYCGSVIGPPGVFAWYNYGTTDAYLQRILGDALANTNNRPDVLLILIGTNDIGHGRDPRTVATNDIPGLLDVIFSNAPNTVVILAKIPTLQNAGLGYNVYAANVPIFNAALQATVNYRRALGQKVWLADMFSAVDYGSMFLSDHLHPNPLGLKAIANEWAARIETILVRSDRITSLFITGGAEWKYDASGQFPETNWADTEFNDSGWSNGMARLGYGDPATATTVSFGPNAAEKYVTTYFRRSFVVPWDAVITNLNFRLARAHGAVVRLNGQEVFRVNLPAGPISHTNLALTTMSGYTAHVYYPTNIAVTGLPAGTNLIAVEVHLGSVANTTLGFDLELVGNGYRLPPPSLSITPAPENQVLLRWPAAIGSAFTLHSASNLAVGEDWRTVTAPMHTNGSQIVVTQASDSGMNFYRLQQP